MSANTNSVPPELETKLRLVYEEVMWLARRPHVEAGVARHWYHLRSVSLGKQFRRFSGRVSYEAMGAPPQTRLVREHSMRLLFEITRLVERHLAGAAGGAAEFVRRVIELEQVDIVTGPENTALHKAQGDPVLAGIRYIDWVEVPLERRQLIWEKKIKGNVINAAEFKPGR